MYETKAAATSLGILGPLMALIVYALGLMGVDASADLASLPTHVAGIVDSVMIVGGIVAGVYGRYRASKRITGIIAPRE